MRIAIGRLDLDHALAHFQNRNVERAAAKVVDGNRLVLALVEPVRQRRRRGLINNALHFEAGNLPGIFGSLPLRVIKVCRHGDDRFRHLLAQVVFGRFLQLLQDQRRNLRRSVLLPLRHHGHVVAIALYLIWNHLQLFADLVIAPSHEALDRINRVLRIGNGLPLGDLPHQPFAGLGEPNDRRGGPATLFIRYNFRLATLHNRHAGVGGAEVDSNNLSHNASS